MLKKLFPIFDWMMLYKKSDFKGDFLAGLIVAIMLVPQGMAYAMLAGLPPVVGLYAATIPAIIYTVFGTSNHLSVGPVALVSILVFSSVSTFASSGSNEYFSLVLILMLMIGLIQFLLGVLRLGFLVNYISQSVMNGFISAAAIIVSFSQLDHLLGIEIKSNYIFSIILEAISKLSEVNLIVFILGVASTLILLFFRRYLPRLPGSLIVVGLSILVVYFADLQSLGVTIIGQVPQGFPTFSLPKINLDVVIKLLPVALTISFIGFMESISIGKVISAKENYTLDPNKELVGLGLANVVGSFFSGYPVAGSLSRSAVNHESGGKTQLSSFFTAVFILLTLLFFTDLFYYLPHTVLSAIIIVAVYNLIDIKEVKYLFSIRTIDGWIWIITFIATLIIGVEVGIVIGLIFSLLVLIAQKGSPKLTELGYLSEEGVYRNVKKHPDGKIDSEILIFRIDTSLHFANMTVLEEKISNRISNHPKVNSVILDFSGVNSIDAVAIKNLENWIDNYDKRIDFYFVKIKSHVMELLKKANWKDKHETTIKYSSIDQAMKVIKTKNK
ncbi:MAG TPA: sulfate permease [Pseudogracilibacillus sp.]|nr:sulfate permease [Pseudogracilibacillus sp.]